MTQRHWWMVSWTWLLLVIVGWIGYYFWQSRVNVEAIKARYWVDSLTAINHIKPARSSVDIDGSVTSRLMADVKALSFPRYTQLDRKKARAYIAHTLTDLGYIPTFHAYGNGVNILVDIVGTAPEQPAVLIGAHYDTVHNSPGADDNASGVAAALEIARRLKDNRAERSVIVVFFDGEERGMEGSRAFASGPGKARRLHGAIILEMLGYACKTRGCQRVSEGLPNQLVPKHGEFLAVIGDLSGPEFLLPWVAAEQPTPLDVVILPVLAHGWPLPDSRRSDHASFWAHGLNAVMVTDTANFRNPHYHETSDKPATLSPSFLAAGTTYVWWVLQRMIKAEPTQSQQAPADAAPNP